VDLAKIRKKSLQSHSAADKVLQHDSVATSGALLLATGTGAENSATSDVESFQDSDQVSQFLSVDCIPFSPEILQVRRPEPLQLKSDRIVNQTPLEIILAGRVAAGCDLESEGADEDISTLIPDYSEFLSFRVSNEIYGINILDIKEIIKPRTVTEVPRTPAFLSGIISLRGTIIPIMDMRKRLDLPKVDTTGKERVVVIRSQDSFSGLLVDEILQVLRIQQQAIEPAPSVLDGIDRDFVSGIGRAGSSLIIILNLATVTDSTEY
jgi:purine-binding chemotaxis protein CheW